jgi:hypothetical protein
VILTFFYYYKVSLLIKSEMGFVCNNKMHIQSCMFNFLSKLKSYIEFDGFSGEKMLKWM